jgi:hypothetical protein
MSCNVLFQNTFDIPPTLCHIPLYASSKHQVGIALDEKLSGWIYQ